MSQRPIPGQEEPRGKRSAPREGGGAGATTKGSWAPVGLLHHKLCRGSEVATSKLKAGFENCGEDDAQFIGPPWNERSP
ncbi:hypothetical protein M752DRAFT_81728 [Aspergillus phoenicis ATCC 13157]|uniref:Uncharacterized protein n=2 Tax=Aspergillus TaxID=5052 RepID=A0A370P7H6_ASPPH|nr:hypothetical protein M747DRAFT_110024 [Aspergillus niger ATCC 13496]RDK38140.1 hypothetical protein M752DRAFT_81728 [Aspergillus phoenicis ATCC 13157]